MIVRGSAAIYGCEGPAPYFFTEDLARETKLRTRFQRDISELEEYFDNFARRHPEIVCCMLRYQPEVGADLDSPLVRYLTLPVVPVQLGYDPRLQLLHADDATAAIVAAVETPVRGAVNVAPSGSISLSRALRLCGRTTLPVPHPLFEPALSRLGTASAPAGWSATGSACCATAAASTTPGYATRSASSPPTTRRRRSATSPRRRGGAASGRAFILGPSRRASPGRRGEPLRRAQVDHE